MKEAKETNLVYILYVYGWTVDAEYNDQEYIEGYFTQHQYSKNMTLNNDICQARQWKTTKGICDIIDSIEKNQSYCDLEHKIELVEIVTTMKIITD